MSLKIKVEERSGLLKTTRIGLFTLHQDQKSCEAGGIELGHSAFFNGSSIPTERSFIAPPPVIEITSNKIKYFCRLDKYYLEQEYIKNGKSMAQIAREKGCARSTVSSAISEHGLKQHGRFRSYRCKGQLAYGEKMINGRVVPHHGEQRVFQKIMDMRSDGLSYGAIVNWLNSNGHPTKNRTKGWDRPTVYKILNRRKSIDS